MPEAGELNGQKIQEQFLPRKCWNKWGPFWLEKNEDRWLPPLSDMCLRDQTYSALLQGAKLGSGVDTRLSHGSEGPECGQWMGERNTWWDFFSLLSLPPVTLLSSLSRVGVGQCGGEGLPSGQIFLDSNSCGWLLHLLTHLVTRAISFPECCGELFREGSPSSCWGFSPARIGPFCGITTMITNRILVQANGWECSLLLTKESGGVLVNVCAHTRVRVSRCAYLARGTKGWAWTIEIDFGGMVRWREGLQISWDAIWPQPQLLPGKMCQDLKGLEDLRRDILENSEKNSGDLYPDVALHKMWWQTPPLCHHSSETLASCLFVRCEFSVWKRVAF